MRNLIKATWLTFDKNNKEVEVYIEGEYVPAERGSRGSYGEPLEPDYDAYVMVTYMELNGIEYDADGLSEVLGQDADEIERECEEALRDQYNDDEERYYEAMMESNAGL